MNTNQNFGIAIHVLAYLKIEEPNYVTSTELSKSINTNAVVIRRLLNELAKHNLIITKQGRFGSKINSDLKDITFYDVYKIFHQGNMLKPKHEPSKDCPMGSLVNSLVCKRIDVAITSFEDVLKTYTIDDLKTELEEKLKWK